MDIGFGRPCAAAHVSGRGSSAAISGTVFFYCHGRSVLVVADIYGLPHGGGQCGSRFFGFHIHEGSSCAGAGFPETKGHYNPNGCEHPFHAGDLPPLLECDGHAYMAVLTDRFRIPDIIGRVAVIHSDPDDFTTQPSGNSGDKIACGIIRSI